MPRRPCRASHAPRRTPRRGRGPGVSVMGDAMPLHPAATRRDAPRLQQGGPREGPGRCGLCSSADGFGCGRPRAACAVVVAVRRYRRRRRRRVTTTSAAACVCGARGCARVCHAAYPSPVALRVSQRVDVPVCSTQ